MIMNLKKIILAGGTGFLGQSIIDHFKHTVPEIVILTRSASRTKDNLQYIQWDGSTLGEWTKALEGSDVLINLTGKSVDCRYTEENKREIIRSRVDATNVLAKAISGLASPPKLWMNAASATIYRHAEDRPMDEDDGEQGEGFSVEVCKIWEEAFNKADVKNVRKMALRVSMVLGKGGGVLPVMKKLVNAGLGGKMGSGKQYISWIHETDFINALEWLIEHEELSGPINIASPNPLTNSEFMAQMREIQNKSIGLPAAEWMLELGAFFIQTETELILKSRRVVPKRLLASGFKFKYPQSGDALLNLLK